MGFFHWLGLPQLITSFSSPSCSLPSKVADMTTLDARMTTDSDEQTHHSESEMITIGDLAVWHQMPFLSVRRLTQLICTRWSMWDSYNIARITKARMLDNTRDWYFPIILKKPKPTAAQATVVTVLRQEVQFNMGSEEGWMSVPVRVKELFDTATEECCMPVKELWSSWSGIWHRLPPMTQLPHDWLHFTDPRDDIIASAGGLFLIKAGRGMVQNRLSKYLNPVLADSNPSSVSDTTKLAGGPSNGPISSNLDRPQHWKRLLVCNPLTRECRELPAADCRQLGLQSWRNVYWSGVQARLVVDEEANCYQVILTLSRFVAVYTSTINSWNCFRFPQECPWGRSIPLTVLPFFGPHLEYICGSAYVGGRLYFADVQSFNPPDETMDPSRIAMNAGTLRLFEVNAGSWHVVELYTLRKFHMPSLKYGAQNFPYEMATNPYVEILECMGGLYAILPAKVHDACLIGVQSSCEELQGRMPEALGCVDESGRMLAFLPLCFYIMQLQEHGVNCAVNCGVLRIQVPRDQIDFLSRVSRLIALVQGELFEQWTFRSYYSCEARGSVIWVACEDYLLSFDVVSRESKTQILSVQDGTRNSLRETKVRFAYRPSLHMKP